MLGFADDTLIVTSSNTIVELESIANVTINRVEGRISNLGLQIAAEKTEVVVFTHKYKWDKPLLTVCGSHITLANEKRYLGMIID